MQQFTSNLPLINLMMTTKQAPFCLFNFIVNQALNFSIEYAYAHDSMPPINSDKIDESISTKFTYRF